MTQTFEVVLVNKIQARFYPKCTMKSLCILDDTDNDDSNVSLDSIDTNDSM